MISFLRQETFLVHGDFAELWSSSYPEKRLAEVGLQSSDLRHTHG